MALGGALLVQGCSATRHLPPDAFLVKGAPELVNAPPGTAEVLASAVKTKANRRLVLPKAYLHAWSLGETIRRDSSLAARLLKPLDPNRVIRRAVADFFQDDLGEAPLLVDTLLLKEDAENLSSALFGLGYLRNRVNWVVWPSWLDPVKARVKYIISPGPAYRIRNLRFVSADSQLIRLAQASQAYAQLRPGDLYNEDALSAERDRLTELLREQGYYNLGPNQISYVVDTTINRRFVADTARRNSFLQRLDPSQLKKQKTSDRYLDLDIVLPDSLVRYHIADMHFTILHELADTQQVMELDSRYLSPEERAYFRITERRFRSNSGAIFHVTPRVLGILNLNTIIRQVPYARGELFSVSKSRALQRRLRELGIFRSVYVRHQPDSLGNLDLEVELLLLDRFNLRLGAKTLQTEDVRLNSNLPGAGVELEASKKNAFQRAELLSLGVEGKASFYRAQPGDPLQVFYQYGARAGLSLPRLLFAEALSRRWKRLFTPTTDISLSYSLEQPVEFRRSVLRFDWAYSWNHRFGQPNWRSQITPLSLNVINADLTDAFAEELQQNVLDDPALLSVIIRDFQPRFSSRVAYALTYSDSYARDRTRPTWLAKGTVEAGGSLPWLLDVLGRNLQLGDGDDTDGLLNGTEQYGQFWKLTLEGRLHLPLGKRTAWVSRLTGGYASGFNYTKLVLFENRLYAGGTSSVRGWQSNTLGPGRLSSNANQIIATGGNIKLEANTELRQKLGGYLELALFMDAGNVWFSRNSGFTDPQGVLSPETFSLGLAGGLGLRFDLTFVVVRLDVGQQLFAPDVDRWLVRSFSDLGGSRIQYNLAIDYPF